MNVPTNAKRSLDFVELTVPQTASSQPTNSPQLHSVNNALKVLNIGRTRFYEILRSGELKAVKIGRRTLIPEDQIVRFIQRLATYPCEPRPPPG